MKSLLKKIIVSFLILMSIIAVPVKGADFVHIENSSTGFCVKDYDFSDKERYNYEVENEYTVYGLTQKYQNTINTDDNESTYLLVIILGTLIYILLNVDIAKRYK
ncbi:MAG: hypothetical protein E7213_08545 [Clostridium sp.]|nr:hypothetical protein [Clostridium sp.]